MMFISVILSTYNSPTWLEKVIWGYSVQTHSDFEIVVADDGSGNETADLIARLREQTKLTIQHVWQEDDGFRKCEILNKATMAAKGDYVFFSDGDCVPRPDVLALHNQLAEKGRFLSGGYYKLTMPVSEGMTLEAIREGRATNWEYLKQLGQPSTTKSIRLRVPRWIAHFMDIFSTTKASWNGNGSSGFKEDILAVNGHDERMGYGGQDRELGERLENNGIRGKRIRFRCVCVHLDHARGYRSPEGIAHNKALRAQVRKNGITWTEYGIAKGPRP